MNGLLSFGVVWGGYTLIWYGLTLLRGPGLGIGDLVRPSQIAKCQAWWTTTIAQSQSLQDSANQDISKGQIHPGNGGSNDVATPQLGKSTPSPSGQIGTDPGNGQPVFSA